jgi:RHS repeat-associated protein
MTTTKAYDKFHPMRWVGELSHGVNQYTSRTVPGAVDVIGSATNTATVTVNDLAAYRKSNYCRVQLPLTNAGGAVWQSVTNLAVLTEGTSDVRLSGLTNNVFLPQTPESFTYDLPHEIGMIEGAALLKARVRCVPSQRFSRIISRGKDGNLAGDGRWVYTWDLAREIAAPSGSSGIRAPACTRKVGGQRCLISRAEENRLVSMTNNSGVPSGAQMGLSFTYDSKGRRISKSVIASGVTNTLNFVYDGWNLLASLTNTSTLNEAFTWGLDLSGSVQGSPRESGTSLTGGAGGVGGLLFVNQPATQTAFAAYDGNGNVSALVSAANGSVLAQYEYGPFGELIRATGPMAKLNPFRYSTKYQDDESDIIMYPYRPYSAIPGRWLARDPAQESGGMSLYGMLANNPVNDYDSLGMWGTDQHHALIDTWLARNPPPAGQTWEHYRWHCIYVNVPEFLYRGNDVVDGVGGMGGFCDAQSSANAYQHSMRAWWQSVSSAQALCNQFIDAKVASANSFHDQAVRELAVNAEFSQAPLENAIMMIGEAQHPVADNTSPPHKGFQVWFGPVDGVMILGIVGYAAYVETHHLRETPSVYESLGDGPANTVAGQMHSKLLDVLKE